MPRISVRAIITAALLAACAGPGGDPELERTGPAADDTALAQRLEREVARIDEAAAAADSVFQPLPLLTPGDEQTLRSYSNARQLASARAEGVGRALGEERLRELEEDGSLIRLGDGEFWVLRDLDHSQPLVVPGVQRLLEEIGARFQKRLDDLGAPAFRMEISSGLRTAGDQEALRQVNPNAALGESAHEYGTTVDVLYSAFAAPIEPIAPISTTGAPWLDAHLREYAAVAAERVAARRAMEIKAVLGAVLMEMQREGVVMVTLERQQPVYHMTLAGSR